MHATDLGYDLTIQIQAAQNLLNGRGLSIYSIGGEDDLASPNKLVTLTYFPCGYSFCAAALLALGLSVAAVLKIGGVAGTLLGWWGWARLAYSFFSEGFERSYRWRWTGFVIAIVAPLLDTPRWFGTEIFLWAAVPWVLEWVVRASDESRRGGVWFDFLAGVACGFCVLMRYASLFLPAYAGFLILCQSKVRLKVVSRRAGALAAGVLPFIALQLYLNQFAFAEAGNPGGIAVSAGGATGVEQLWVGLSALTSANYALVWWIPRKIVDLLTQPGQQAPSLLSPILVLFALPLLLAIKLGLRGLTAASRDIRTAAAGVFVALPLFLWACATFGQVFVGIIRYYIPLLPLAVFVAYAFAVRNRKQENKMQRLLRMTGVGYLTAYLGMAAIGVVLLVLPGEHGSNRRKTLVSSSQLHPWPSTKVIYEFSASRNYVLALLKEDSPTVLVTNLEHWFYADPSVDRSRLHRFRGLRASHITGPARVLIMAEDPFEVPEDVLYTSGERGDLFRVDYFQSLPNLHLLKKFPAENVKVLEARIPAGTQIALNKPVPKQR